MDQTPEARDRPKATFLTEALAQQQEMMMTQTTWLEMITDEMQDKGDDWRRLEAVVPNSEALDVVFDDGFGGSEGPAFTLWTKDRVYFPVVYDGSEWVGSVARNPCDEASGHHGGE